MIFDFLWHADFHLFNSGNDNCPNFNGTDMVFYPEKQANIVFYPVYRGKLKKSANPRPNRPAYPQALAGEWADFQCSAGKKSKPVGNTLPRARTAPGKAWLHQRLHRITRAWNGRCGIAGVRGDRPA
jgi:hypothetical protein